MQREHRIRPRFAELVQELRGLHKLSQQGVDMDTYALPTPVQPPLGSRWRSLSMGAKSRPLLPQASPFKLSLAGHSSH